jgi:hypothetical protein
MACIRLSKKFWTGAAMREVEGVGLHEMTDAEPLGPPSLFGTYKKLMQPQFSVQMHGHTYHRIDEPYTTHSPFSGHCCQVWAEQYHHSTYVRLLPPRASKELWRLLTIASSTIALSLISALCYHRFK